MTVIGPSPTHRRGWPPARLPVSGDQMVELEQVDALGRQIGVVDHVALHVGSVLAAPGQVTAEDRVKASSPLPPGRTIDVEEELDSPPDVTE